MCQSIAPDCIAGAGLPYVPTISVPQLEPEVNPILYIDPRPASTEHPNLESLTAEDVRGRYGTRSRNRFFDRNESDNPIRVLTTPEPVYQIANSFPINNQYAASASTDSGIKSIHLKELLVLKSTSFCC